MRDPSPRVLHRLANLYASSGLREAKAAIDKMADTEEMRSMFDALGVPPDKRTQSIELPTEADDLYALLMDRANYPLPRQAKIRADRMRMRAPLEVLLHSSSPLTPDEIDALTEYLAWYRSRHGPRAEARKTEEAT